MTVLLPLKPADGLHIDQRVVGDPQTAISGQVEVKMEEAKRTVYSRSFSRRRSSSRFFRGLKRETRREAESDSFVLLLLVSFGSWLFINVCEGDILSEYTVFKDLTILDTSGFSVL